MSSTRLLRSLTRVAQRQPFVARSSNRPTFAPAMSSQVPKQPFRSESPVQSQVKSRDQPTNLAKPSTMIQKKDMATTRLHAAMPQLIPFFFVNQTVANFSALVILIYFMTKYALPNKLRIFLARLFISKL